MGDLRKCSRCHSTKLDKYFSYNVKGELFKTCDNCRNVERKEIGINVARLQFLNNIIENSGGDLEYQGHSIPDNINFPADKFEKLSGKEISVEYHKFYIKSSDSYMIARWRLKTEEEEKEESLDSTTASSNDAEEYYKQYYSKHKEKILSRAGELVKCKYCSKMLRRDGMSRHITTKTCCKFQDELTESNGNC